ncbi:MAG TPA: M28 family peptidase [Cyclobacteriaceae bacterium]|nr:M28 family peptidase [Cyclobacteriaceae bacterium]
MLLISLMACTGNKEKATEAVVEVQVPVFNPDSAYRFAQLQVNFGPRIPNTAAHQKAGDFLVATLKKYGAVVTVQSFKATSPDGQRLDLRNIIGAINPKAPKRILMAAHWDTRPYADKDPQNTQATFDGANDGASGVAVLLELARLMHTNPPSVGIDIFLFDGEDWGEREGTTGQIKPPDGYTSWWCLGSQYWARNKHKPNYTAYYGILLDMVGASNAHFVQEGTSMEYAPRIVEKVWSAASRLGYSSTFLRQKEAAITDDHVFINTLANIPTIDIVHFDPMKGYFGDFHHTQKDSMTIIDRSTLRAVGSVVLDVVYRED